jgi:hypothetical protein
MPVEFKEDSIKDWILNNLDEGQVAEVVLHGCAGGVVSELIYYADSCAFYDKYKEEIWQRLWDSWSDFGGDSVLHFIATFNGADDVGSDDQFRNLLAWWSCEDVCREVLADKEDKESNECLEEIKTALGEAT